VTQVTSLADIITFLRNARPGDRYCYATAYNLVDTLLTREIQKETYGLATRGLVYLVQRRVDRMGLFDYFIIKASKSPITSLIPYSEEKLKEKKGFTKCQVTA